MFRVGLFSLVFGRRLLNSLYLLTLRSRRFLTGRGDFSVCFACFFTLVNVSEPLLEKRDTLQWQLQSFHNMNLRLVQLFLCHSATKHFFDPSLLKLGVAAFLCAEKKVIVHLFAGFVIDLLLPSRLVSSPRIKQMEFLGVFRPRPALTLPFLGELNAFTCRHVHELHVFESFLMQVV